jgi:3-isopropylmalate dehydrogenase
LMGAVGGPKWDAPEREVRPEQGLLRLRRDMGLFANLRPVRVYPELLEASPLKVDRLQGVDMLFVRELTGGLYFGRPRFREKTDHHVRAVDTLEYRDDEIRRVVRLACMLASQRRGLVTSVDKANILETSRLWRQVVNEVAPEFPAVRVEHQLVQAASEFDVLVTSNMFGDILTDEASVLSGSLGLLPSASLGEGSLGVYEPIHGSAPDIAGKGIANPIGATLSAAMLLRHSLGLEAEAREVEAAVERTLAAGYRTADIATAERVSTEEFGSALIRHLDA